VHLHNEWLDGGLAELARSRETAMPAASAATAW
jgi:hypothetical protein